MALKRHMKSSCFHPCCPRLIDQCLLPLPISTIRPNHSMPHTQQSPIPVSAGRSDSEHKVTECNVAFHSNKIVLLRYVTLHTAYTSLPRVPHPNLSHFVIQSCQSNVKHNLKRIGASGDQYASSRPKTLITTSYCSNTFNLRFVSV